MNKKLAALRRKLERAELELLRRHVVELDAKLEQAERRVEIAETRAHNAECVADMWHEVAHGRDADNQDAVQAPMFGLKKDGQILRVDA